MYLTTLDLTKYTALGSADYPAYTLYNSISEVIGHRISPEAAALLAEPIFDDSSKKIDYIVDAEGELGTLDSLTGQEKNLILDKLTYYSSEIRLLADSYIKSDDHQAKRIGHTLRHTLYVPEAADIYVVDGEPVLTGWGLKHRVGGPPFDISRSQSLKVDLTPPAPANFNVATPKKTAPTVRLQVTDNISQRKVTYVEEERKRFPWLYVLLAILGFLLMLLLLWRLLSGDKQPTSVTSVVPVAEQPVAKESAAPKGQAAITPPEPVSASSASTSSKQANSTVATVAESTSLLTKEYTADTTVLVIPKRAIETGDMGFLYGEWASITDLIGAVSKEPLTILYAFDQDGSGTTTIIREPSEKCEAPVKAEFKPDGRLYIQDQTDVLCADDVYFPKSSVICEVAENGKAVCQGQQIDNQYNVTLKRSGKRLSMTEQLERELTSPIVAD